MLILFDNLGEYNHWLRTCLILAQLKVLSEMAEKDVIVRAISWPLAQENMGRERPYGVGYLVLKGSRLLQEVVASGENVTARVTAIPCKCSEQAVAAKQTFGTRDYDA